jgi:serine/threonine protein kinase
MPHSLFEDRRGNLWFATSNKGLALFKDDKFTFLTTADGLLDNTIWAIYEDPESNLWIGTSGGLNRLRDYIINTYSKSDGLSNDNVYPIYRDSKGDIWIGSTPGLTKYSNGIFTRHDEIISDLIGRNVKSLFEDREGNLWLGFEAGIVRVKDGRAVYKNRDGPFFDTGVRAIYQDRAGVIWFGTEKGLVKFKDGVFSSYKMENGLAGNFVSVIYEDRSGTLWIGTQFGLSAMRDGEFHNYAEKEGLSGYLVRAIYEDTDGVLWIGTYDGGLNRLKDDRITSYTTKEGLFDNGISQILEDDRGYLWMSCNLGIYRVKKRELNDLDEGKTKTITCVAYGKRDGMLNIECNGGGQPAGIKARDGRLWFPTVKGVVIFDPEAVLKSKEPPPVVIEEILVDNETAPSGGLLTIQSGKENFEIQYTGLSFIMSDQCKFKYKLVGLDSDWIDAGTRRTAYYSHVPPGDYNFIVIGANRDGVWNLDGARVAVSVLPPLWRTWWAYLLYMAGLAGVGYSSYRYRLNAVEKRYHIERASEIGEKNKELEGKNEELKSKNEELIESRKQADRIFSALAESLPGTVLDGKYKIDEKIGSGGYGAVYRGTHLAMKYPIAVKIFKPMPGNDSAEALERFQQEAITACRIHHPNAVAVLDSGISAEGIAYLVMELLQGRPLTKELYYKGKLTLQRSAQILAPVCEVLSKAHSMGIVHRDIKPDNIFLHYGPEGEEVKVIDFGIAKLMETTGSLEIKDLTATGRIIGTPTHISPERIQNQPYDGRSDVYSLGVVLYQMLCGELPFESRSGNVWSLIRMHLEQRPQSPREINPNIPEAVEALILRALEKDPEKRPTAMELKQEFLKVTGIEVAELSGFSEKLETYGEIQQPEQMGKILNTLLRRRPDQLAALLKQTQVEQSGKEPLTTSEEGSNRGEKLSTERWQQIGELFLSVIELEPELRAQYLEQACAGDEDLRSRVEALIAADEEVQP